MGKKGAKYFFSFFFFSYPLLCTMFLAAVVLLTPILQYINMCRFAMSAWTYNHICVCQCVNILDCLAWFARKMKTIVEFYTLHSTNSTETTATRGPSTAVSMSRDLLPPNEYEMNIFVIKESHGPLFVGVTGYFLSPINKCNAHRVDTRTMVKGLSEWVVPSNY